MKACLQIKPMYCSRDYNFPSRLWNLIFSVYYSLTYPQVCIKFPLTSSGQHFWHFYKVNQWVHYLLSTWESYGLTTQHIRKIPQSPLYSLPMYIWTYVSEIRFFHLMLFPLLQGGTLPLSQLQLHCEDHLLCYSWKLDKFPCYPWYSILRL